jgi:undecaprenyl pyrophosphate synthase
VIYRLPEFVQEQLKKTQAALAKHNGLTLILALSYGGRQECGRRPLDCGEGKGWKARAGRD